jgi:hypothetical protein
MAAVLIAVSVAAVGWGGSAAVAIIAWLRS